MMRTQSGRITAALAIVALGLAACTTGNSARQQSTDGGAASKAHAGSALLTLAGHTLRLSVERCVQSSPTSVNLTAEDAVNDTLVVNLAEPVSDSTLVYTARKHGNSFTNYALATTVLPHATIGDSVLGDRLSLRGQAVPQQFQANGKTGVRSSPEAVVLDATCKTIQRPMPAPASGKRPTHRKEGLHKPHGSPRR